MQKYIIADRHIIHNENDKKKPQKTYKLPDIRIIKGEKNTYT